jgi:hypothetical protein
VVKAYKDQLRIRDTVYKDYIAFDIDPEDNFLIKVDNESCYYCTLDKKDAIKMRDWLNKFIRNRKRKTKGEALDG